MGLICDSGLPPSVAALASLNYFRLSDNPDLAGPIPSNWAYLTHLSECPISGYEGYTDDNFMPQGYYCGLDARNTGLCDALPSGLVNKTITSYGAALPPCAPPVRAYADPDNPDVTILCEWNVTAAFEPTPIYNEFCAYLGIYNDLCIVGYTNPDKFQITDGVTSGNVTCGPPPPAPPPPPYNPIVCIQPSQLAAIEVYLCVAFW